MAAELLAASAWFDEALLARLARRGWPKLSATRSRIFLALWRGPVLVSDLAHELARRIGPGPVQDLREALARDRGPVPTDGP